LCNHIKTFLKPIFKKLSKNESHQTHIFSSAYGFKPICFCTNRYMEIGGKQFFKWQFNIIGQVTSSQFMLIELPQMNGSAYAGIE
jgi:hypothetical protein